MGAAYPLSGRCERPSQLDQSKQKIAQLEAALNAEISARQAADGVLQNNINAMSGGGVTQAALDAAIAAEASARSAADATLRPPRPLHRAAFDATLAPVSRWRRYVTVDTAAPSMTWRARTSSSAA